MTQEGIKIKREKLVKKDFENEVTKNNIEKSANYEGNASQLFYERLQNPEIKKRIVDMICEYQKTRNKPGRIFRRNKNNDPIEVSISEWKKEIKSREQIEKELDKRIKKVFSRTNLAYGKTGCSFSKGENDFGTIAFQAINPETNRLFTTKQLSIAEAHEKGHGIRDFRDSGKTFKLKIQSGLNFSKVEIPKNIINIIRINDKLKKKNFLMTV